VDRCKVECKYCHKRFLPRKLIVHNQYFCGPNSKRSAKLALRDKKETAAKKQRAMDKAMATLDIINNGANEDASSGKGNAANGKGKGRGKAARKHSLPTMTNIYRDLMEEANREPTGFYSSKEEAQRQAAASMRKREIKKETNPASDNNSKSDARSTEEAGSDDFEEETNVRERRNLWATDDGSFFFYKHKGKTWGCNAGITLTGLRTSPVVLQSTNTNGVDSFQVKFLNGAGAAQLSIDNGETWSNWVNGRWITPKKGRLNVDERKEGWQSSGPKMGALLARTFDKKTILAAIVAHAPAEDTADDEESPALWRIEHTDGDEEDLEVIEVKEAEQLFSQAFAPSTVVSTTLAKPLISALEALSQDTAPLAKSKGRRASAAAANKKMKAKKAATAKKTKKGDEDDEDADGGSDSDFEPKSSSDDNGDDDEGDEDNEDNADGSENVDEDSDEKPKILDLKPCFRPVEWGPGSKDAKFLALFKTHFSTKTGKSKKVKAKKRKRKANARSATPSKSSKGAKGASAKSVPGPKAKSKILDESSEESDFESSDSSDEEDEIDAGLGVDLQEAKDRCEGDLFWFAPPGDIVDDDGIDMGSSILHCIGWNRIVLDEAHKIKDRVNSTAKAVLALRGTPVVDLDKRWPDGGPCHRWCLSGTPLQNRVGDLYSLVRFLRVDPYAFYLCKVAGCECRSLHWAMGRGGRVCDGCGHPPMRHYSYFNKVVVNPIKRNGYVGEGRMAMKLLRDDVLAKIMLRRTKKERQADIKLPPCTVEVRNLKFTEHERDFYESVYKNTRAKFDTYVGKGTVLHNYAHIFELLSRLRRAADHPYLVVHGAGDDPFGTSKAAGDRTKRTDICGICQFDIETLEEVAVSQCKHTFHRNCVDDFIAKFQGSNNNDDDDDDDDDPVNQDSGWVLDHDGMHKEKAQKKKPKSKPKAKGGRNKKGEKPNANIDDTVPNCPLCYVPLSITLNLKGGTEANQGLVDGAGNVEDDVCVVCMDRQRDALLLPCGHIYLCMQCARGLDNRVCPMCRTPITRVTRVDPNVDDHTKDAVVKEIIKSDQLASDSAEPPTGSEAMAIKTESAFAKTDDVVLRTAQKASALIGRRSIMQRINTRKFSSSTKVDAVVEEVKEMLKDERKDCSEPNKAIVFSQYNDMLDLIQWRLFSEGIVTVKLVGALSMMERRAVLEAFKTKDEVRVILLSLKAGGEGLNLTEASHVFLCDPWWNQAVSDQAVMRCHRIGQKRSVKAVHFVIANSIEQKMMQLQEKKSLIFEGAVDGNSAAMTKLTEEDLRFLFSR